MSEEECDFHCSCVSVDCDSNNPINVSVCKDCGMHHCDVCKKPSTTDDGDTTWTIDGKELKGHLDTTKRMITYDGLNERAQKFMENVLEMNDDELQEFDDRYFVGSIYPDEEFGGFVHLNWAWSQDEKKLSQGKYISNEQLHLIDWTNNLDTIVDYENFASEAVIIFSTIDFVKEYMSGEWDIAFIYEGEGLKRTDVYLIKKI